MTTKTDKTYPCPVTGCETVCTSPGQLGGHVAGHRGATPGDTPVGAIAPAVESLLLYCECGSALTLRGETDELTSHMIEQLWREAHTAQQHELTTSAECNLQRLYRRRRAGGSWMSAEVQSEQRLEVVERFARAVGAERGGVEPSEQTLRVRQQLALTAAHGVNPCGVAAHERDGLVAELRERQRRDRAVLDVGYRLEQVMYEPGEDHRGPVLRCLHRCRHLPHVERVAHAPVDDTVAFVPQVVERGAVHPDDDTQTLTQRRGMGS